MVSTISVTQPWTTVCSIAQILPNTGVCALIEGKQVAIFRVGSTEEVYALSNYDPFSKAHVLSRGIVGDRAGVLKVASPIYKHNFSLVTGQCLDDENVAIEVFAARVIDGEVQVSLNCAETL